jgi:hypothetical protein
MLPAFSQIAPPLPINKTSLLHHHHQSTKQACFGNQRMLAELLLYDMCVTPANIVEIFNTWLAVSDS